jgi:hypothetical protein
VIQSFFIPGPLPGMNDFAGKKSRWHYRALKEEWGEVIGVYIHMAKLKPMQSARVTFTWNERDRKRDPDNIMTGAKFVLDALVSKKVLRDDGWDEILAISHHYYVNKAKPGVTVTLEHP